MLSPSGFTRGKSGSIIGDLGNGLLSPKTFDLLKRGVNHSPLTSKLSPTPSPTKTKAKGGQATTKAPLNDENEQSKVITMNCGVIQFKDIVIPPSAPTDLICEECEVAISVLHCRRCRQVFCMKCAESCHPKPYGKDYHPHESEEHIRAVQFGDTSRVKHEVSFVLPDVEMHEEDYINKKDLSKPYSLSTSLREVKPSLKPFKAPKFSVLQVVLFKDPHTEREAYGKIISEWDQRHGTMATPAILRGDHSIVFYMVQVMGFTKDVVNIATLLPHVSSVEKIDNYPVIEGVDVDEMMHHRKRAHLVNKKIAAAEGVRRLGPKHHLRDVVNYNIQKDQVLLDNREFNLNSAKARLNPGDALLNSAIYNSNLDDMSECVTIASSTASQRQLAANKHRKLRMGTNNEYIINPTEFQDDLYDKIDLNLYADIDTDVQSQLSFDNPLSHPYPAYHRSYQHVLNGPGADDNTIASGSNLSVGSSSDGVQLMRLHQSMKRGSSDSHRLQSLGEDGAEVTNALKSIRLQRNQPRAAFQSTSSVPSMEEVSAAHYSHSGGAEVDVYTKRALQVLVLSENDMITVQERIANEVSRKNNVLRKVWDKMSGSEKLLMKEHGFRRWRKNVGKLRDNQQHIAAIIIQSLARKYLCRDTLAEKTEQFIARQHMKRRKLHGQFRYSDASDPRAVTMNDKIYFKTHLDLNRYAALLRVLMYKLAKYLARKRFAMMRAAITKWRGGLTVFLETDIQSSHINDIAIDCESSDPSAQFGSVAHQKNLLTAQHVQLRDIAENVVITSPDRQYPNRYVDELGHDTVLSLPLRLPDVLQLDRTSELSQQIEDWSLERSMKMAMKASAKLTQSAVAAQQTLLLENRAPSADAEQSVGWELSRYSAGRDSDRGDSQSFSRPASPNLDVLPEMFPSGTQTPLEQPLALEDKPAPDHALVPSYFPSQGVDLPPLPTIYIPRTAQERLFIKNERRLDYASYRESMVGPTFDSNWVIPDRLSMGCMPWGAAEVSNTEYPVEVLPQLGMSMKSTKMNIGMGVSTKLVSSVEITPGARALNTSTNATSAEIAAKAKFKTNKWKPPPVTAVSALLLNRVDFFVSLMDEDEEEAIEFACKVPSVQTCIQNALATANAAVMTIISQCMAVISKQTKQLDDIPRYGKSDPRYPAATREILRCKARMQLATDNMHRAKQQIKNLPPRADFIRIPLRIDGIVTPNQLLPKIWQIEELLQQGRNLYIYSRDGHGRAGLVAGTILGRLYNLHPYEALYRIQACHDSAKRESERSIPINCPQLPLQRELLTQILHLTNRPQEMTFIRAQIYPDTFVEHKPQRPLLYDTSTSSHASVNGSYLPTQSFLNGVSNNIKKKNKMMDSGLNSFISSVSVVTAVTPRSSGGSDGLDSPMGGRTAPSTARTGKVSLMKAISWRSIQLEQEEAALEAAAKERDEELGNNHEVIDVENEFLAALYQAQNIRKQQTMTMKGDAPFTWNRGNGITHRGDALPTTHSSSHMPPEPMLPDLYQPSMLGQSVDVARKLPTRRPEPTQRPHLPQIRTALTPQP